MRKLSLGVAAFVVAVGFSVWAFPGLPERVPTHWNFRGQVDGWSSPLAAVAILPGVMLLLGLLFSVIPRIDPRRESYQLHGSTYWTLVNAVLGFMAMVHVLVLGKALGWNLDMTQVVTVGVGALFVLIGNLMTRIRPNWFMGIRTPWTLSSDTVWRKTHRMGGVTFVIAGLVLMLAGIVGTGLMKVVGFAGVVVASLVPVVYSWFAWKKEQETPVSERPRS
jgi:uncharacterized membrane protein